MAVKTTEKFKALNILLIEQKKIFLEYHEQIKNSIEINEEIIDYIKEVGEGEFGRELSEMWRDGKIFISRMQYLKSKLNECNECFESVINITDDVYKKCLNKFLNFYYQNREVSKTFTQSQKKWLKIQDLIMSDAKYKN